MDEDVFDELIERAHLDRWEACDAMGIYSDSETDEDELDEDRDELDGFREFDPDDDDDIDFDDVEYEDD